MAVFQVTLSTASSTGKTPMEAAIEQYYPNAFIKISDLAWLVEDKEAITPQGVAIKLGGGSVDKANALGSYILSSFSGYWGYHNSSVWQWLQQRGL